MERHPARVTATPDPEETRRRLTSEVSEVEGAIELVSSGAASRVTLTGLRFGEQVARRFRAAAASKGICLEPLLWPEDAGCDLVVAQGTEAGGHTGQIATMALVPQIVDAVGDRIEVWMDGGIRSGRTC